MSLKSRELYMQKHKCNREQDIVFGGHIICTGEKTKIKKNEVSHVRSPEELMSEFGLKF